MLICEQGENLPFDIAQMRTIFFSYTDLRSADHCRTEIVRQLRQALNGAVDSPVAASVDLQRLQTGNNMERTVAELVGRVTGLQGAIQTMRTDLHQALRRDRARVNDAWAYASERQQEVMQDLNQRLKDLLSVVDDRKDTDLKQELQSLVALSTALKLSFPTPSPWRASPDPSATLADLNTSVRELEDALSKAAAITADAPPEGSNDPV